MKLNIPAGRAPAGSPFTLSYIEKLRNAQDSEHLCEYLDEFDAEDIQVMVTICLYYLFPFPS